ncbi:kdo(2)-lipid A phosphoethanolamine 7''-transferase [Neisseriaceae bacterium TC5R-5]|nr:kdo(2)-lipid A phosphoethanolamine 7''-transferase [Neisseriaceae bacterium TC5R-5]
MNKIKSLLHKNLSLWLGLYIGLLLNLPVFYRRLLTSLQQPLAIKLVSTLAEAVAAVLFTYLLLQLCSLAGRWFYRFAATLLLLTSVAASYYVAFFGVVIGYGVIASVITTDIDLSVEVIGWHFVLWTVLLSALPLLCIWQSPLRDTLLQRLKMPGQRLKSLLFLLAALLLVWLPLRVLDQEHSKQAQRSNLDLSSYGGGVVHAYLPANWLSALGLFAYTRYDEYDNQSKLFDPAQHFRYVSPAGINDTYMVFIIGETTRWDHLGLLGYARDTTPKLSRESNLLVFRGESCDTSTKLSLRCMFVREGGAADNPQRTLKEQNVFAVLKQMGFSSELFAMQSEVWFYNKTEVDNYAFRELITAEGRNEGKPVDDMLLLEEVAASLARYPQGKHLVILHTKGSHYQYSQRYPPAYARYQPECLSVDSFCSKAQLINAYDNSVLYTDAFISKVIDQLRDKKAIVFYAADHGESIAENEHLHGTPRQLAPAEQFRVPIMVWASDKYLASPQQRHGFEQLAAQQRAGKTLRHVQLFDTILGCLGYTSPNGGIVAANNGCQH